MMVVASFTSIGVRLAIAPLGDAIARELAKMAVLLPPARPASTPEDGLVEDGLTDDSLSDGSSRAGMEHASAERMKRDRRGRFGAVLADSVTVGRAALAQAKSGQAKPGDGGASDAGASKGDPDSPKGTIVIPASAVAAALEKRNVSATDAKAADGSALGARLHGVSRHKTGLRDGDIVVAVEGARTPTVSAMVSRAMQVASGGASRLTGRIRRGEATYVVVLELPR
jgi:hypothetical protein